MVLINYCVKCLRHSQNINVKCLKGTLSSIAVNPAKHWIGVVLVADGAKYFPYVCKE